MENDLIKVTTHQQITLLFKQFLQMLEDIQKNNEIMLKKVSEKTSEQFSKDINYFTPEFYEQARKRVLDNSNDVERNLLAFLDYFDFVINQQKIAEATQKRVTKKTYKSYSAIIQ